MSRFSVLLILILLAQIIFPQSMAAGWASPHIVVMPLYIDFGNVPVGSTSSPQTITVTNAGDADLVINQVAIVGRDVSQFLITGNITGLPTIPPGESANGTVIFKPTSTGFKTAKVTICSNDPTVGIVYVTLMGNGTKPHIIVVPTQIDFGIVDIGDTSDSANVTVSNVGDAELDIGTLTINNHQFSIASGNISGAKLDQGDSANITLVFQPSADGPQSATLFIPSNDTDQTPSTVSLNGSGHQVPPVPEPHIIVFPTQIDFGIVDIGDTSDSANVTVSNVGDAELDIGTLTINNDQFSITSGNISGAKLDQGDSANITLVFQPSADGPQSATLFIPSNDTDQTPSTVSLNGSGHQVPPVPEADLAITKTDSPDLIALGDNLTYTLTVKNNGPDGASGIGVTDNLWQYLVFVSANDTAGTADVSFNATNWTVNWNVGDLASGDSATLDIVTTVNPLVIIFGSIGNIWGSNEPGVITNTANVTGNEPDPDISNNTASEETRIQMTDLEITKSDKEDPVTFGDNITWTITVSNDGPLDATDVLAMDLYLPQFITLQDTDPTAGSVSQAPPQWLDDALQAIGANSTSLFSPFSPLYWDIGGLASGSSANLTIIASANATFLLSANSTLTISPSMIGYISALVNSSEQIKFPYPNYAIVFSTMVDSDGSNNLAEETTSLWWDLPETDLAITKTDSPDPVAPDGDITYTLNIRNNGPEDAPNVYVMDSWDENALIYKSATATQGTADQTIPQWLIDFTNELGLPINAGDNYLWWDAGPLAIGESANLTMIASVNATMAMQMPDTDISNTGLVFGNVWDTDSSNNTVTENTTIGRADLAITKTAGPEPVAYGDNITYTLTVTNNGPTDASGINVTDELPASVTFQSANASAGTAEFASGNVTWDIGSLGYNASANLTIVVQAPDNTDNITNTATVNGTFPDPDLGNNSASANTTVVPPESADLAITKTASPEPVATGANITYKITVRNNGPANASGVSVTDELPGGVGFPSINTSMGTANYDSGNITWNIGGLDYGTSANLTIIVQAPDYTDKITNTASVSSDNDPIPGNNSASANTTVVPPESADVEITKTDSPDPVNTGDDLTYTLTVTNNGPASAAGISVTDQLPDEVTYRSHDTATGTANSDSGNVTWSIESLDYGESANLTIVVSAPGYAANITNTASVSSDNDPIAANNHASENTTVRYVVPSADLSITKTASPDPVNPGGNLTYTITVTNLGPDSASDVNVTDKLPQGVTYQSHDTAKGAANNISGNITWSIGSLDSGESANLTILVTALETPGFIINTANVSGDQTDPNTGNNGAWTLTTVANVPDITVIPPEINFGSVKVGSSGVTRTVTVRNDGTADLYISGITIDSNQFDITSGENITKLMPGTSANITVIFRPTSSGGKSGAMTITSNDPDEGTVGVTLSGTGTTSPGPGPGPGPNPPEEEPITTVNYFTVDFQGLITKEVATSDGRPIKTMKAPSPDGDHLLEIEADTQATDNTTGDIITLLEIREAERPELPENTELIGKAYEFKPSGTVFDRPVRLTLGYNANELPDRVTSVGLAYYTTEGGWQYLETVATSVAELGKLTAPVSHFTVFAVLATVAPAPPPPEPTPQWTPELQPETRPEPTAPAQFTLSNLSIATTVHRIFKNFAYIVRTGGEAAISVDVTNQGGQSGSYAVILIINGTEWERNEISLEPGQTQTVSFTITNNEPGNYSVAIGDLTGNYLSKVWINWWLIGGSIGFLIIIGSGAWYFIRKKMQQRI
jgi:uncharacterized repeat protein (TIGR01451 family)